MTLNELAAECKRIREEHGFVTSVDNLSEKLMLMVEELTEAHGELRDGHGPTEVYTSAAIGYWCVAHHDPKCAACQGHGEPNRAQWIETHWERYEQAKPEGFPVELADALIRILDVMWSLGIDVDKVVAMKMSFNETRPFKHGRLF